MKSSAFLSCCLFVVGIGLLGVGCLQAQSPDEENFPGVKKALTTQQFADAGLGKLSPAEQSRLDEALREYISGATKRVADQAVDRAVKKKQALAPDLIESRIVGTVSGWKDRTVFVLENGQRWKPVDNSTRSFAPVENPVVFLVRDIFGYKMAIGGAAVVRVKRL